MSKEYECADCNALFTVDIIEDSDEASTPQFCPFCGSEDIGTEDDHLDDDEDDIFDDDED